MAYLHDRSRHTHIHIDIDSIPLYGSIGPYRNYFILQCTELQEDMAVDRDMGIDPDSYGIRAWPLGTPSGGEGRELGDPHGDQADAYSIGYHRDSAAIHHLARIEDTESVLADVHSVFRCGDGDDFSADFIFNNILQDHQRKRIEVLLGMKEDPSGVGYNVNQSMIAIGSGGMFGKGYMHGTQTTYGFVPEQSTDFIFCTVGEEWGFLGCAIVIGLYVALILQIMKDAERSRESFTRIYGYCFASCLFMHLFINIGMTIGIMPVIGIPLPFMSYGGSSLWAFTIMLAIFLTLDHREKKYF